MKRNDRSAQALRIQQGGALVLAAWPKLAPVWSISGCGLIDIFRQRGQSATAGVAEHGTISMSFENEDPTTSVQTITSKMEVIESALEAFATHLRQLDNAGFSMASIHLNAAIERLNSEKVALAKQLKI